MGLGFYEMVGSFIVNSLQVHVENHLTLKKLYTSSENIRIYTKNSKFVGKHSSAIFLTYLVIWTFTISYNYIIQINDYTVNIGFFIYGFTGIYCILYILKSDVYFTKKLYPKCFAIATWIQGICFNFIIGIILLILVWNLADLGSNDVIFIETGIFNEMGKVLLRKSGLYSGAQYCLLIIALPTIFVLVDGFREFFLGHMFMTYYEVMGSVINVGFYMLFIYLKAGTGRIKYHGY